MQWTVFSFNQLTTDALYELLKLRVDVFVVEQACAYPELDDKDRHPGTRHLLLRGDDGALLAYSRILAPGVSYPQASIGRVVVAPKGRGQGLAHTLMSRSIALALEHWPAAGIQIGAQQYLQTFYHQLGFVSHCEVYLEDGIAHLDMLYLGAEPN